jgi:hypothetical protein
MGFASAFVRQRLAFAFHDRQLRALPLHKGHPQVRPRVLKIFAILRRPIKQTTEVLIVVGVRRPLYL